MSVASFRKDSFRKDAMSTIAKITSKGQTTIPVEIRESLNFKPGDLLEWEVSTDGSAKVRRIQPLDCPIQDIKTAGLPVPSRVRLKLFTLDNRLIRGKIGALSPVDANAFKMQFDRLVATG